MKRKLHIAILTVFVMACNNGDDVADAYGNFESEEVLVSAKVAGELLEFDIEEGGLLKEGQVVGVIDTTDLHLQRLEIEANIGMIKSQYQNITAQIEEHGQANQCVRNPVGDTQIPRRTSIFSPCR